MIDREKADGGHTVDNDKRKLMARNALITMMLMIGTMTPNGERYTDFLKDERKTYNKALKRKSKKTGVNIMETLDDVCKSCQEFTCDDCKIWEQKHRRNDDD